MASPFDTMSQHLVRKPSFNLPVIQVIMQNAAIVKIEIWAVSASIRYKLFQFTHLEAG